LRELAKEAGGFEFIPVNPIDLGYVQRNEPEEILTDALPLIADVVEAAEGWSEIGEDDYLRLPKFAQAHYGPIHEDETPTLDRCFRLSALTALRDALEEK
jgi:hypothetical protein